MDHFLAKHKIETAVIIILIAIFVGFMVGRTTAQSMTYPACFQPGETQAPPCVAGEVIPATDLRNPIGVECQCTVSIGGPFEAGLGTESAILINSTSANTASGDYSFAGGEGNIASAINSFIGGGKNNNIMANATYGFIGGGEGNSLFNAPAAGHTHGFIGGGKNNKINDTANYSVIAGGLDNIVGDSINDIPAQNASIGGGSGNIASGNFSTVAGGTANTASGTASFATGSGNIASGVYSTAIGIDNTAIGVASFAVGSNNIASGLRSFSAGLESVASGDYSTAFGYHIIAESYLESVFGRYNNIDDTPESTTGWNVSDKLFVIGNGTGPGSRSNAMTVLKNGYVGIGVPDPKSVLQVSGYVQLGLTKGAPPPSVDCDEVSEEGRMKFDPTVDLLYICGENGWVSK